MDAATSAFFPTPILGLSLVRPPHLNLWAGLKPASFGRAHFYGRGRGRRLSFVGGGAKSRARARGTEGRTSGNHVGFSSGEKVTVCRSKPDFFLIHFNRLVDRPRPIGAVAPDEMEMVLGISINSMSSRPTLPPDSKRTCCRAIVKNNFISSQGRSPPDCPNLMTRTAARREGGPIKSAAD